MKSLKNQVIRCSVCFVCLIGLIIYNVLSPLGTIIKPILYGALFLAIGWDTLLKAAKNIIHGQVFDENFLMTIASIGAFIIGEYPEAVAVMLFYRIGDAFEEYAVNKSRKSISELMNIRPERAIVERGGTEITIAPEEVVLGDTVVVRAGERIPVDGVIIGGKSSLDTSALTGESLPRDCGEGDEVLSGCINIGGMIRIRAEKIYADSTVSKILDLVENASGKKAKTEKFISRFSAVYTPTVVCLALVVAILPPLFNGEWMTWIYNALNFLVISCPCALVISVPLGFFGGIGGASRRGILFKGANSMETILRVKTFVFDKTGTLTEGKFGVVDVSPKADRNEILRLAAIAEHGSNHPIAKCICETASAADEGYSITEISGKGICAEKNDDTILCGNALLMKENGIAYAENPTLGSVVYVAKNNIFVGSIVVADSIKSNAAEVISALKADGCQTVMLTGDNEAYAAEVSKTLGLNSYRAKLLPADKVGCLEDIIKERGGEGAVGYVGDGINDAPVLMRSDVGISMGGVGSDSAIEASDVVLMRDDLSGIITARRVAKKTLKIVRQNIVFALSVKIAVMVLSLFGIANLWLAVFADVGVSVLAVLNSMRAIGISSEHKDKEA